MVGFHKSQEKVYIIVLVPNNNPPGYKEHVISFIVFYFLGGVAIIYRIYKNKLYLSHIVK